ncbi:hypothetical protein [Conexibacter sp. DBS9H8]|uniref:hypothetical protein n=1 Tax=Conexibacter sp. DBS9H8 TaxID=2937801 RepID=UPI00200D7197|nr:hypothetical protein [Conexibacter sp. DBS9H8]
MTETSRLRGVTYSQSLGLLRMWPGVRWTWATGGTMVAAVLIGVPTRIVPTPLFGRMTPVTWWDYPVWAVSSVLSGMLAASYVRCPAGAVPVPGPLKGKRNVAAMLLSGFAVGCPICNKVVVGLIGVSGALNYWAPLQPLLGVLSVMLLAFGLAVRLRGEVSCSATGA